MYTGDELAFEYLGRKFTTGVPSFVEVYIYIDRSIEVHKDIGLYRYKYRCRCRHTFIIIREMRSRSNTSGENVQRACRRSSRRCIYIYIYINLCIGLYRYRCIDISIHIYMYIYIYIYIYI